MAALSEAIGSETVESRDAEQPLARSGLFGPVERASFSFSQRLDRETLLQLVLSRSYCASRTAAEREPVLRRVGEVFDEHARGGAIELPYLTECFRTVRRSQARRASPLHVRPGPGRGTAERGREER